MDFEKMLKFYVCAVIFIMVAVTSFCVSYVIVSRAEDNLGVASKQSCEECVELYKVCNREIAHKNGGSIVKM